VKIHHLIKTIELFHKAHTKKFNGK
jgi:hypothetical protein